MTPFSGWSATERRLDSGGFESRQRAVVPDAVVESSESGARWLGIAYWQTVGRLFRGGVRARWRGSVPGSPCSAV